MALGHATGGRYREPSAKQINRETFPGSDTSALVVVAIERVEFSRAGADEHRRAAMPIHGISEHALVGRIHVKHGDAVAPAAIVAECTSVAELGCYLGTSVPPELLRVFY